MGCGFLLAMVAIGAIRELFGNGTILGFKVFGSGYNAPLIFVLSPGAFIVIGYLVGVVKVYNTKKEKRMRMKEREVQ